MAEFARVAAAAEVPPGQAKMVEAGRKKIALFNVGGAYYAIDDTCPHRGGPLSQGPVEGGTVTCPWHGSKFEIKTGAVARRRPRRVWAATGSARAGWTSTTEVELS